MRTAGRILAFDSGIGGLSIVDAIRRHLPHATIDYLADNAVYPYGELADDRLIARVIELLDLAIAQSRPDVIVIACNTASTVALDALREHFDIPFVGCVPPIKWAASLSRTRTIGLLATRATVRRPYVQTLQQRFAADCSLLVHGARGLADIAEDVFRGYAPDDRAIARELAGLLDQPGGDLIDTVCIGCTHYSIILPALRRLSPRPLFWLDPADAVARQSGALLQDIGRPADTASRYAWFTTTPRDDRRVTQGLQSFGFEAWTLLPFHAKSPVTT